MFKTIFITILLTLANIGGQGEIDPYYIVEMDPNPSGGVTEGSQNSFYEDCALYGITIGDGWSLYGKPTSWTTFCKISATYKDEGELQFQTDIQQAVIRYKETSTYCYLCRMVLSPVCKERKNKVGDNWYFKTAQLSTTFDGSFTLGDWSPKTETPTTTTSYTIGFDISMDPSLEVSASFEVTKGLKIVSETNVATNYFSTLFDFSSGGNVDYNHNSAVFMSFAKFSTNGGTLSQSNFPYINFEFTYYGKKQKQYVTTSFQSTPYYDGFMNYATTIS
ncbi:MAG: hypothetical protein LUB56_02375 [Coprobacillus sp.]|nr:hypothetical protein [Coprobacillus sp.]